MRALAATLLLTLPGIAAPPCETVRAFLEGKRAPAAVENSALRALFDARTKQPTRLVFHDGLSEVWSRPLASGRVAVALFNTAARPVSIDVIWKEMDLHGSPRVRDVLAGEDRSKVQGGFAERVEPGECAIFVVIPEH
jgi:hypothetical protein